MAMVQSVSHLSDSMRTDRGLRVLPLECLRARDKHLHYALRTDRLVSDTETVVILWQNRTVQRQVR